MSRIEKIMKAIIDETSYDEEPQSRIEKQLISILKNEPYEDELQSRIEILIELVREYFSSSLEAEETLKALIDRSITSIDIPQGMTNIGSQVFNQCRDLASVTIPDGVTNIGSYAFSNCYSLVDINIPDSILSLQANTFVNCNSLTDITLPSSITRVAQTTFSGCTSLTNVTLGDGFNANALDLSASTLYSTVTLVGILNALADRTGLSAYTLTFGSTNLAKLSDEQIAIATEKNWTLA